VLHLAKLMKGPKEGPFKARLILGELSEGVSFLGVGVERASDQDFVPILLVCPRSRFHRLGVRGFVRDRRERKSVEEGRFEGTGLLCEPVCLEHM
jgi:hypothetical protein